jgi:non-lysosomal glucosylceramidase
LKKQTLLRAVVCFLLFSCASMALAASDIPKAAWSRPIGLPLESPGVTKDPGLIDDGYWQGAPVGGMGAGTFSRSYRGDFSRWHIKAGVHKYETVYVNEFAMYGLGHQRKLSRRHVHAS